MNDSRQPIGEGSPEAAEIARWLSAAGRRPAVSAELLTRVRSATHEEWREIVGQRRQQRQLRRRWVALAAAGILAAVGVAGWTFLRPAGAVATVAAVYGQASTAPGPQAGEALAAGARLSTAAGQRWVLTLKGGASVRLDEDTSLVLESPRRLALERGAIYVDAGAAEAGLTVTTAYGEARDIGTQFELRLLPDALRLRVREGQVRLAATGGGTYEASAGDGLLLSAGGVEAMAVPLFGEPWAWLAAAPAPFSLEGADLGAFLDWVGRETGLEMRFTDSAAEPRLRQIRIHGTIESLSPEDALSVVLPGAGLRYELSAGVVTLGSLAGR
jgi:ferric-dicitrate binding protein FerR (iron transport regulator)